MLKIIKLCKFSSPEECGYYCRISDEWCFYDDGEMPACPMYKPEGE